MDIQTIQCFISVSRCLNFTKAADECHITQAAMSKKISSLENELGTTLFYRDNRQVELTPAGSEFFARANTLMEAYSDAIIHTRNIANGFESSLKLGIGVYEHLLLHRPLEAYCAAYPGTDICCSQFLYKSLAEHLTDHLIDIMISTDQYLYSIPGAEYHIIYDAPWRFACSRNHPLASRDVVPLSELSDYAFITMNDGSHEQIRRSYLPFGFDPRRFYRMNSYNTKILAIRANLGISTLPAFTEPYMPSDICFINTTPEYRPRKFVVAYLKENTNPSLKKFISTLLENMDQPPVCASGARKRQDMPWN